MTKFFFSFFITIMLIGCGGQVTAKPINVCLQPSDGPVYMQGCDASVLTSNIIDPVANVAHQAMVPGSMILWAGKKQNWERTVAQFTTIVDESKKYGNKFEWVYLYDEIGWCPTGLCWFDHEDTVLAGAAYARSKGLKTLVTILPDVILDPRFNLKNINAYDGISIDVYPSIRPTVPNLGSCRFSDNELENLFYCSAQKLRSLGFTGQIGYIFQGFGLRGESHDHRMSYLIKQRQAIDNAAAMGATAVMSFGKVLGVVEQQAEPELEPLGNTIYEPWINQ
jgi:hypothetical protein